MYESELGIECVGVPLECLLAQESRGLHYPTSQTPEDFTLGVYIYFNGLYSVFRPRSVVKQSYETALI